MAVGLAYVSVPLDFKPLKVANQEEAAVVVSLTHLSLPPNSPLAKNVTAYQNQRVKKLAKLNR